MFKNLFIADLKMMVRNRQALLWAFMFPLIFTFIFGLFFGKNSTSGSIAIVNHSNSEISRGYVGALQEAGIYKIVQDKDLDQAKDDVKKSKLIAIVEIPESFGNLPQPSAPSGASPSSASITPDVSGQVVNIITDQANAQANAALVGFTDKFLAGANLKAQNVKEIFAYKILYLSDKELTYFDFILVGILGLAIMNSSVIGVSVSMTKYREDKILKRITTTPLPTWTFISSEVLSRLILNFVQITAVLFIGLYIFDANIYGSIPILILTALVGALLFQLIGFVVAAFSKTTDAAQGLATFVTIPMMFLAGVFFPIDSLPNWLASIVQYLPLAPLLRILRAVAFEISSPFADMKNIYIVLGWIILTLFISIWKFRLTEE